jgi:5'-nucleotidase
MHRPLKVAEIREHVYSINGTPTDCIAVGVSKVLHEKPSLIVSVKNSGDTIP